MFCQKKWLGHGVITCPRFGIPEAETPVPSHRMPLLIGTRSNSMRMERQKAVAWELTSRDAVFLKDIPDCLTRKSRVPSTAIVVLIMARAAGVPATKTIRPSASHRFTTKALPAACPYPSTTTMTTEAEPMTKTIPACPFATTTSAHASRWGGMTAIAARAADISRALQTPPRPSPVLRNSASGLNPKRATHSQA